MAHHALKKNVFEAKVGHTYDGGVTYQYEAGGKVYRRSMAIIKVTMDELEDYYARYPETRTLTVYYRPGSPQESRLPEENPGNLAPWAKISLGAVFMIMGLAMAASMVGKTIRGAD